MFTDEQQQQLKTRFLARYHSDGLWGIVRSAYTEPHRQYHDLSHLAALFASFDRIRHLLHHPDAVEDALWWHDLVYSVDKNRDENEVRSAMLMRKSLVRHALPLLQAQPAFWDAVEVAGEFILATIDHAISSPVLRNDEALAADAAVFLDMDLAVLAEDEPGLRRFEAGVRQEYIQYDDRAYTFGRIVVLKGMLNREKIFLSPVFAPLEPKARANLQWLIAELTAVRERCQD